MWWVLNMCSHIPHHFHLQPAWMSAGLCEMWPVCTNDALPPFISQVPGRQDSPGPSSRESTLMVVASEPMSCFCWCLMTLLPTPTQSIHWPGLQDSVLPPC